MTTVRPLAAGDLDALFVWENDPRAIHMAAFTRANPDDRDAFDAHYERIRNDPDCTLLAIEEDGEFVGTIGSFWMEGEREVTYWISPARWGQGVASRALRAFLEIEPTRPIRGRVADHNVGSAKVLARAGFVEVGTETAFARGVGAEVVEHVYRLDGQLQAIALRRVFTSVETKNETFREVNLRIRAAALRLDGLATDFDWDFLCECGTPGCMEFVGLQMGAFDALLVAGGAVLARGHVSRATPCPAV